MNQNLPRTLMREKTILYLITQSELGGAQRYVFDLATSLHNEFNCIIAFGEQGDKGELAELLKSKNVTYYQLPHLKRAISPINDFLAMLEIIKLIKKVRPNIIHLNSSKISILGSIASLLAVNYKTKIIYTAHGWVFNEPMPTWKKLFYKYAEKITAYLKDKIICVSKFDELAAIGEKIAPEKKLITIHNGIKPVDFLPKEQAKEKLFHDTQHTIHDTRILIGTIGNLYPTKGFEYLIKSIKIIVSSFKFQVSCIIIGEGKERKNLENLIKKYKLGNNVILAGRINNAAELLKAFDIYICSSVKEGLSYTIIEAMQAGLPIVATQVGGNSELIEDKQQGLLANSANPHKLAEQIAKLIKNPELSQELANNAQDKARSQFTLEKMIEKTNNLYL